MKHVREPLQDAMAMYTALHEKVDYIVTKEENSPNSFKPAARK